MKICVVDANNFLGGGQIYIERLIELLQFNAEFNVITFCDILALRLKEKGVNCHLINKSRFLSYKDVISKIEKINSDIIIFNGQFEAHYSWFFKNKTCFFIRHTSLSMTHIAKKFLYFIESRIFPKNIIVVNDFIKEQFPLSIKHKVEVIHNWKNASGTENINLEERLQQKEFFNLLYCGRIEKDKNVSILCESCREFTNIFLYIIGTGNKLETLKSFYKEIPHIIFLGYLPYEKTQKFYEIADIYLHLSNIEAFPLSVLDAFFYGIPCILSNIPAHRDISSNGESAILTDIDVKKIKLWIEELIRNQSLRYRLSVNALNRAKDFTAEKAKQKYIELLGL